MDDSGIRYIVSMKDCSKLKRVWKLIMRFTVAMGEMGFTISKLDMVSCFKQMYCCIVFVC